MDKETVFLVIPFLALLVGAIFTYFNVWYNKAKREADESDLTDSIIDELRKEHINKEVDYSKSETNVDLLAKLLEINKNFDERISVSEKQANELARQFDELKNQTIRQKVRRSPEFIAMGATAGLATRAAQTAAYFITDTSSRGRVPAVSVGTNVVSSYYNPVVRRRSIKRLRNIRNIKPMTSSGKCK